MKKENTKNTKKKESKKDENSIKIDNFEKEITILNDKIKEYKESILRLNAEIENQKRRYEKEISQAHKYSTYNFALSLLPVLDAIKKGLQMTDNNEKQSNIGSFIEGLKLTEKEFIKTIEKYGIKAINAIGENFDPNYHEALSIIEKKGEKSNTILEVVQVGYTIYDRVLRPAKVLVAK